MLSPMILHPTSLPAFPHRFNTNSTHFSRRRSAFDFSMDRQPRKRRRPALSCIECRRRKIKCDRNDPCQHCVSARSHCAYLSKSNGSAIYQNPHPLGSAATSNTSSVSAESPLQQLGHGARTIGTDEGTSDPAHATTYTIPIVGLERQSRWLINRHSRYPERDQRASSSIDGVKPGEDNVIILDKTIMPRWSDWMGLTAEEVCMICPSQEISSIDNFNSMLSS